MNKPIYHLANPGYSDELAEAGTYTAPSLDTEGFIHCCTADQLPGVIQRYYADAQELVLLHIDTEQLTEALVFENTSGGTELFPHVYGKINAEAVLETVNFDREKIKQVAQSQEYLP